MNYYYMPVYLSPSASPEVLRVEVGASVDPAFVLDEGLEPHTGFLRARHIPQRPRPLANCLVVGPAIARAANYGGKGVSVHINRQPSKLERTPYEFLGPPPSMVVFDD
jgi:hypothetical protein